jgi:hypothetical protein
MSVTCRFRVAASTAALSMALALAMTGTALAAAPSDLPQPGPTAPGFTVTLEPGPVPTTPALPLLAP